MDFDGATADIMLAKLAKRKRLNPAWPIPSERKALCPGPCWEWTGAQNSSGYGVVAFPLRTDDRGRKSRRIVLVHRLSLCLVGEIELEDTDTLALHQCDNPLCFNPDHLNPGDYQQNNLELFDRGRNVEDRLDIVAVRTIRKVHREGGSLVKLTYKLRRRCGYNLKYTTVRRVALGLSHADVDPPKAKKNRANRKDRVTA